MIKATERILRFFLTAVGMAGFCLFLLPQTAGCTPRVVISGSMEPAVPVGSIVYTNRWIKQENIKEGDIIAYGLSGGVSVLTESWKQIKTAEYGEQREMPMRSVIPEQYRMNNILEK